MIKAEEFENGIVLALTNNVEAIAHFSVGMGGRTVEMRKVLGFVWVPLNKQGFLSAEHTAVIEKLKDCKTVAEMIQMLTDAKLAWVGSAT